MSFINRGYESLLAQDNPRYHVSDIHVPYRVPAVPSVPLLVITDLPNPDEEQQERFCTGPHGRILKQWFDQARLDPRLFPILSVFRYRPLAGDPKHFFQKPEKGDPICQDICGRKGAFLLEHFRNELQTLRKTIVAYRPEAVLTLGSLALWAVINHERSIAELAHRPDHMCTVTDQTGYAKFTLFPAYKPSPDLVGEDLAHSLRAFKAAARYVRPA